MNLTEDTQRRIDQFNKAASERLGLAYHLIPAESLRRLSRIFLEGLEKYPEAAVNGRNLGGAVGNREWQVERFNYAVDHLLKWGEGDGSEDHLAKVMWFCSVMIAVGEIEEDIAAAKAEGKCKVEGPPNIVTGWYICRSCEDREKQPNFECCNTPDIVYSPNNTDYCPKTGTRCAQSNPSCADTRKYLCGWDGVLRHGELDLTEYERS